jgi:hypothetical protein
MEERFGSTLSFDFKLSVGDISVESSLVGGFGNG